MTIVERWMNRRHEKRIEAERIAWVERELCGAEQPDSRGSGKLVASFRQNAEAMRQMKEVNNAFAGRKR